MTGWSAECVTGPACMEDHQTKESLKNIAYHSVHIVIHCLECGKKMLPTSTVIQTVQLPVTTGEI